MFENAIKSELKHDQTQTFRGKHKFSVCRSKENVSWKKALEFCKQIPSSFKSLFYVSSIRYLKYTTFTFFLNFTSCRSMTEIRSAGEINSVSNRLKNSKKSSHFSKESFWRKFRHIIMQRVKNNPRTIKYVVREGST